MTDSSLFTPNRRALFGLAAAGLASAAVSPAQAQTGPVSTSARIVILGSGAAGTAMANRLVQRLDGAQITIMDGRAQHWYQPGFTLIAAGLKTADYSISDTKSWLPEGVDFIPEYAAEIDPEGNRITTASGKVVEYDYLIVAAGISLDWDAIEGFDMDLVGQNGLGAVYASPEKAAATWSAMDAFTAKGGVGVFGRPGTEMKCAGAPLKYTFITDDYARKKGTRGDSEFIYQANNETLFGVPIVDEKVKLLFRDRGFDTRWNRNLVGVDPSARKAYYEVKGEKITNPDGSVTQGPATQEVVEYDFINVIPPQRAPKVVRESGLSWADKWVDQGWIEVDKDTLRHLRYPNVFGVGDICGVPKGKTAASVKWQIPVVEDHLVADIAGTEGTEVYNGYTSCPMITRIGRAMLIEFDYNNNLTPSFPGVIAPLEELWVSWLMKEIALKPTYNAMLRGKA